MTALRRIRDYLVRTVLKAWGVWDNRILARQPLPTDIVEDTDVPYLDDGQRGHLLDVYYPQGAKDLPVIVDVHGGGFLYGYKELNRLYGYHLAKRGFVVFNLNYRLAFGDIHVPDQIRDIAAALNWVARHIPQYPACPSRVFLTGESAGGVLATMVALIAKSERLRTLFDVDKILLKIKAISLIGGMMRFDSPFFAYTAVRWVCFERGYRTQEYYQNMRFNNLPEIEALPPVFLATSEQDALRTMTFDFEKTLQSHGVPYQLEYTKRVPKKHLGHLFSIYHPSYRESAALIDNMVGFFRSCG